MAPRGTRCRNRRPSAPRDNPTMPANTQEARPCRLHPGRPGRRASCIRLVKQNPVRPIKPSLRILILLLLCLHSLASPGHPREDGGEVSFLIRGYEVSGNSVLTEKEVYNTPGRAYGSRHDRRGCGRGPGCPGGPLPPKRVSHGPREHPPAACGRRAGQARGDREQDQAGAGDREPVLHHGKDPRRASIPSAGERSCSYPVCGRSWRRLNRNPDFKVSPVLSPAREIGLVDVELKVKDEFPLHGSLEVNNRGTHETSELRNERHDPVRQPVAEGAFRLLSVPDGPLWISTRSRSWRPPTCAPFHGTRITSWPFSASSPRARRHSGKGSR